MSTPETALTRPRRDYSLDGLRGVAALIVVVHHSLLSVPLFAAAIGTGRADSTIVWFVYSPLHLMWAGPEAVYVFFILSGLVLTLPVLRAKSFDWRAYYPSRAVRLYVPVWAAVLLAAAVIAIFPRHPAASDSSWVVAHDPTVTVASVARDTSLVTGNSGVNSALWSLQWEVLFSLLLPVFVWAAVRFARYWHILLAGAFAAVGGGTAMDINALKFLPLFLIGSVLATHLDWIRGVGELIEQRRKPWPIWLGLAVGALTMVTAYYSVSAVSGRGAFRLILVVEVVGAAMVVVLAVIMPLFRTFLQARPIRFLGVVSFSLYLTHEPIIVAIQGLLPVGAKGWTLLIALPVTLLVSYIFYGLVEAPSHRLAQGIRNRISSARST